MESAYTLYIDGTGIAVSPSLEQVKLLAVEYVREGRPMRIRMPGGALIVYNETRRDWTEGYRQP